MLSDRTPPPYFAQFASHDRIEAFVRGQADPATDPLWAQSGAESAADYARWAGHCCGMACLKMFLTATRGAAPPVIALAKQCRNHGGYREEADGAIKGLLYKEFVAFAAQDFGLRARIETGLDTADIPALLGPRRAFIASVHPGIRTPDLDPPTRGGHLVLVFAAQEKNEETRLVFHNPSGFTAAARASVALPREVFARFFAGRGIVLDAE